MPRLLIIADDLTGALDTGVQLAKEGTATLVSLEMPPQTEAVEVLVVDTESRHLDPDEAGRRVAGLIRQAISGGIEFYFKKTDSALRGNIGSELWAMLEALDETELCFIPAFPRTGRTTVDGRQLLDGVPLEKTPFGRDPLNPVTESRVPELIRRQAEVETLVVSSAALDKDLDPSPGRRICIFDALTDQDLARIAAFLARTGRRRALVGCAGFAGHLSRLLGLAVRPVRRGSYPGRLLIVNGSLNEISLRQVAAAEERGIPSLALSPGLLLDEGDKEYGRAELEKAAALAHQHAVAIIKTVGDKDDLDRSLKLGASLGLEPNQTHARVAANLGRFLSRLAGRLSDPAILAIFGGDTALAFVRELGCQGLVPLEEPLPGVVISKIIPERNSLYLLTKSGGFGGPDLIADLVECLKVM